MPNFTFRWEYDDEVSAPTHVSLFVGNVPREIASLTISNNGKWWSAYIDLPGVRADREYAPLVDLMQDVQAKVARFFELASEPAASK